MYKSDVVVPTPGTSGTFRVRAVSPSLAVRPFLRAEVIDVTRSAPLGFYYYANAFYLINQLGIEVGTLVLWHSE